MRLSDIPSGKAFVIQEVVVEQPDIRKRLIDMGFVRGAEGTITRTAPLGDPIEMHIMGYDLSLRRIEADGILVAPELRRRGKDRRRNRVRSRRRSDSTGKA
ncbi:MAG: FeoA family protein [Spirochaetota bacterium]